MNASHLFAPPASIAGHLPLDSATAVPATMDHGAGATGAMFSDAFMGFMGPPAGMFDVAALEPSPECPSRALAKTAELWEYLHNCSREASHPVRIKYLESLPVDILQQIAMELKRRSAWLSHEEAQEYKRCKRLQVLGPEVDAAATSHDAYADSLLPEVQPLARLPLQAAFLQQQEQPHHPQQRLMHGLQQHPVKTIHAGQPPLQVVGAARGAAGGALPGAGLVDGGDGSGGCLMPRSDSFEFPSFGLASPGAFASPGKIMSLKDYDDLVLSPSPRHRGSTMWPYSHSSPAAPASRRAACMPGMAYSVPMGSTPLSLSELGDVENLYLDPNRQQAPPMQQQHQMGFNARMVMGSQHSMPAHIGPNAGLAMAPDCLAPQQQQQLGTLPPGAMLGDLHMSADRPGGGPAGGSGGLGPSGSPPWGF